MISNDLMGLMAAAPSGGGSSSSIYDQPLRDVLRAIQSWNLTNSRQAWSSHLDPLLMLSAPAFPPLSELGKGNVLERDVFLVLEHERSDIASLARFGHRVECASYHLYAAFDKAHVDDFELKTARDILKPKQGISLWYCNLVNSTFNRYSDLKRALLHRWTPPPEAELLAYSAFSILCETTPAQSQLRDLFVHDRSRAFHELTRHLDLVAGQLRAAIELANDLDSTSSETDEQRLRAIQSELLKDAGEPLSLTEAADLLGVSRQALHKRIGLGTALGLMYGSELVVPAIQLVDAGSKPKVVSGLADIVRLFDRSGAGRWSALQFLIETDPNLRKKPIDALKAGERDAAVHAARAYLSLDEA